MYAKTQKSLEIDEKATCVWPPDSTPHWVEHAYFRREVELQSQPKQAGIALYASTEYHLRVNGRIVGTGPVRGYAEAPQYDTYDIAPYLQQGTNTIAVEVQHVDYATFQHQPKPPAFIAWGNITCENDQALELSTPGDWKCLRSQGHDPFPPRFSFSLGPIIQIGRAHV